MLHLQLARNKQLDSFFVRDLNREPDGWAAGDASFGAVLCCVSVQYLQYPEKVFAEIYRVLKPGGVCIISFSHRLYYTKGKLKPVITDSSFAGLKCLSAK